MTEYMNDEVWLSVARQRTQDFLQADQVHRLLSRNGQSQRARLARRAGRLLQEVGEQLVVLGERMEGYTVPSLALPEECDVICDSRIGRAGIA